VLRDAVAEGRLTLEEFSDRIALAQRARTRQELATLTQDVPGTAVAAPIPTGSRFRAVCSHLTRGGSWELATPVLVPLDLRHDRSGPT
jgi:hypothetical protein